MSRSTRNRVAKARTALAEPLDDADVVARVQAGELVPLVAWGDTQTRPEVVAALRARVTRRVRFVARVSAEPR